jgi:hypothetical protein
MTSLVTRDQNAKKAKVLGTAAEEEEEEAYISFL